MTRFLMVFSLALAVGFGAGCASIIRFEVPAEMKKKKLEEDPPDRDLHGWLRPVAPERKGLA